MGTEQLQVNFRMPAELKARLEEAAKVSGRTLTAEIVYTLQAAMDGVRLPDSIVEKLKASAAQNKRTLGSELLHRVLDAYAAEEQGPDELKQDFRRVSAENSRLRQEMAVIPPVGSIKALQASLEDLHKTVEEIAASLTGKTTPAAKASGMGTGPEQALEDFRRRHPAGGVVFHDETPAAPAAPKRRLNVGAAKKPRR